MSCSAPSSRVKLRNALVFGHSACSASTPNLPTNLWECGQNHQTSATHGGLYCWVYEYEYMPMLIIIIEAIILPKFIRIKLLYQLKIIDFADQPACNQKQKFVFRYRASNCMINIPPAFLNCNF